MVKKVNKKEILEEMYGEVEQAPRQAKRKKKKPEKPASETIKKMEIPVDQVELDSNDKDWESDSQDNEIRSETPLDLPLSRGDTEGLFSITLKINH